MCCPRPSAIRETPISKRKLNANIFTVGCRCTKSLIGVAANIMTPTARTTAAIITARCLAMPTAVITESSENTISSRTICPTTAANAARTRVPATPDSPSRPSWISRVLLASRNRPPAIRIRSRPENGRPRTWNSGAVRRMIHASAASRAMRVTIAPANPTRRARACCAAGSLPARIEMKMMLSMPSTISSTVSVSRPSHTSGLAKRVIGNVRWGRARTRVRTGSRYARGLRSSAATLRALPPRSCARKSGRPRRSTRDWRAAGRPGSGPAGTRCRCAGCSRGRPHARGNDCASSRESWVRPRGPGRTATPSNTAERSDRGERSDLPRMCVAPAARRSRCRCPDPFRERTPVRDLRRSCRFRRTAPFARSTRKSCLAASGQTSNARRRRRDYESAAPPPSPRDRAAGTARADRPPPRCTPPRDPDAPAAAPSPVRSTTPAGERIRSPAAWLPAAAHDPPQREQRPACRTPRGTLPTSLECDPEREEGRVVRLQIGPGEKGAGEIDTERATLNAEAHARSAQSILDKRVARPQPHQPLIADVYAESRLRLSDLSPGTVDIGGELHIEGLIEGVTRGGTERPEPDFVQRADGETGGQWISLRLILHLQSKADVAQRDPDA